MPEVTGETSVTTALDFEDLMNLYDFINRPVGSKLALSDNRLAIRTAAGIEFEEQHEVTLEFDMSDYAPDHDWRD